MDIEQFKIKWSEYLEHIQFKSVESLEDRDEYLGLVHEAQTVEPADIVGYITEELTMDPDNLLSRFFMDWSNELYGPDTIKIEGFVSYSELSRKILEINS